MDPLDEVTGAKVLSDRLECELCEARARSASDLQPNITTDSDPNALATGSTVKASNKSHLTLKRKVHIEYRLRSMLNYSGDLELTIEIFSDKLNFAEEALCIRILAAHHARWKSVSLRSSRFLDEGAYARDTSDAGPYSMGGFLGFMPQNEISPEN